MDYGNPQTATHESRMPSLPNGASRKVAVSARGDDGREGAMTANGERPMLILESNLSKQPRYYATRSYRVKRPLPMGDKALVVVTGKKWDVTDQIEAIVARRLKR